MSKRGYARQTAWTRLSRPFLRPKADAYSAFDTIDGFHPWQTAVPDGFVSYPVKQLQRGEVVYFNFALAREMGLISEDHVDELTPALSRKILETFAIQIVNEYDQLNGRMPPKSLLKPKPYMATRYLQLQHANKQGRTSGDGRSIWNGCIRHNGKTWDVSSRGTGVTCLAPGAVEANRPLKTGGDDFGYGCGLADITELWGSAVMSEIFHLNGVNTERVLTIIDLGKGCGIGVRAAQNLIRPAHLFLYLKQARLEPLRQAAEYMLQRQIENGEWKISPRSPLRYRLMLNELATSFARFAAHLERNYIFAWLDWDGDNVLTSAGIIDYGSIRQFGLRHDQYRYDDVQRFSTNLNEQRSKARLIIQVFAQMVDFLETGKRRTIQKFANHSSLRLFDREFESEIRRVFLAQIGFNENQSTLLLRKNKRAVEKLYQSFSILERAKTHSGMKRLPDGVNRPAVFNMRTALRELPNLTREKGLKISTKKIVSEQEFMDLVASSFAKRADRKLRSSVKEKIARFQKDYLRVLNLSCGRQNPESFLKNLAERAHSHNRPGRITGNGAEYIIDQILQAKNQGLSLQQVQKGIELFVASQVPTSALKGRPSQPSSLNSAPGQLFQELLNIALENEEDI